MFTDLMHDIQSTFTERFLKIQVSAERPEPPRAPPPLSVPAVIKHEAAPTSGADDLFMGTPPRAAAAQQPRGPAPAINSSLGPVGRATAAVPEVGRNDPCPCGSGKKYKKCHGQGR
jgi:preprotein translocase subunit SecA